MTPDITQFEKFCRGHNGRRLLKDHSLDEYGLWQARGEMHDSHIEPDLGLFEGKLQDVIEYVVELPRWYAWGNGGSIEPYKRIMKITEESLQELRTKQTRKRELEKQLEQIKRELGDLD